MAAPLMQTGPLCMHTDVSLQHPNQMCMHVCGDVVALLADIDNH